jgi:HEAT repeat protein
MAFVFKELGEQAVTAIDPLLKIASDQTIPPKERIRAITAVGSIGLPAERAVPNLQTLQRNSDIEIRSAATAAILNIGSAEAAPILAARLEHTADPHRRMLLMRDIAELKALGKSAGPTVAKYLNDEDWNVRVGATRALGYIGYEEAVDDLIKLWSRLDDWRLVLSAAESLGRLKAERALPALKKVATTHWYPPVRKSAQNADKAIRSGEVAESKYHAENFPVEYFGYEQAGDNMEMLEIEDVKSIRFTLDTTQHQPLTVAIKEKDGTVKSRQLRGVKVEDGYLVGSDNGEWGGEITFVGLSNDPHVIAHDNTEAIYKTTHGIIAVTGLAHMTSNSGFIQTLSKGVDGRWTATKWKTLPGAPRFSRLLRDGRLLISCYGGIVLVSSDGEMTSLTRKQSLQ